MNLLVIDAPAGLLDMVMRWQLAGHSVAWWIKPRGPDKPNPIGDGIARKVKDWEPLVDWADLIVLGDNTLHMARIEALRKQGYPIFGPGSEGADLELDRTKGQALFRSCGIRTLPVNEFHDAKSARDFVMRKGGRWVSKPSGDADKALSYCAKSAADMIFMLDRWKELGKLKKDFILQRFVPGIEMAVGGWLGREGFSPWLCENFENKKLMPGDLGPATGEMGTVLKYTQDSKLAEKVLLPCEKKLMAMGITGYVDVNCIIDADGTPWPLEWTVRFGYPTISIQAPLHLGDPAEWMLHLATGEGEPLRCSEAIAVGVVCAMPDFPYSHLTAKATDGYPISGWEDHHRDIALCECAWGEAPAMGGEKVIVQGRPVTAGDYVLVAHAESDRVSTSARKAYRVLDDIDIPNSPFWRNDIGVRMKDDLQTLAGHGYCKDWTY